jgi:periplasmic protein TonB
MASSARVAESLPTTLPDDFGEWDDSNQPARPAEAAPAQPAPEPRPAAEPRPLPQARAGSLRNLRAMPAQQVYSSERAFLDQLISMRPEADPPARVPVQASNAAGAIYEVVPPRPQASHPRNNVAPSTPAPRKAPSLQAKATLREAIRPQKPEFSAPQTKVAAPAAGGLAPRTKVIVALSAGAASVILLLLFLGFALGRGSRSTSGARPAPQSFPMPAPIATPSSSVDTAKPSPAAPLNADPAPPASGADSAQAPSAEDPAPPQVQSQMMNDQLHAPAQITTQMKSKAMQDAPPAAFDTAGLGGSPVGNVLGEPAAPRVQAAPPRVVNVSAGVAVGLLIKSTPPVYPQIAKAARVAGTVVLAASISKTGAIENLRVVSGQPMLRQSALDAVRTWRYKPYKVNNQPAEIETTINVVFSLQG